MSDLRDATFSSPDGRFVVALTQAAIRTIVAASAEAGRKETGGILIGRIESDGHTATILEATPKPRDSAFGWLWFRRGVKGLRVLLEQRWAIGQHYLGEWHFHPGGSPEPSGSDYSAMAEIAGDPRYQSREPILAILGGSPPERWRLSVTVTPLGETPFRLLPVIPRSAGLTRCAPCTDQSPGC